MGIAKRKGIIETQPILAESLTHLKRAALIKTKRAIKNIAQRSGSEQDLDYLSVRPEILDALLKELLGQQTRCR